MKHLQIPFDKPPEIHNVMPKVNGEFYRCKCGANVFHWIAEERLECNGCGALYEAIRKDSPVTEL
jgi:hypothetical protein